MKIIYNVTVNVDYQVCDDWVNWMKSVHIPEVLSTGLFEEARFSKILAEESGGASYSIQYLAPNMASYNEYVNKHAQALQLKHHSKYEGKYASFRTLLRLEDHII